jgi:peroxiredoxin (alkyl hydroperoxide reductase subunit C)
MKTIKITLLLSFLLASSIYAKDNQRIPLIGEKAPKFKAMSTMGEINFPKDFGDNWKLILSHPADFTPVCSSEILELAGMHEEFKALNVDVIVVSTDALTTHESWIKGLEQIKYKDQDPIKIDFPLIDDQVLEISSKYGMLHTQDNSNKKVKDVRGVFVIDPDNIIRFTQFYPMEIGRNMEEIKRAVIALQTADKNQVLTPANWNPGDDVLLYNYNKSALTNPDVYQLTWFMTYSKL